jgi:chromosome segregation ATPase
MTTEQKTLWDAIPDYQRREKSSISPPSERIDPEAPGAHFWVIIAKNWDKLHPLMQDILTAWYNTVDKEKAKKSIKEGSTESLVERLRELDSKLESYELERKNLQEELSIRDRDFQKLRQITGKKEKENKVVQQELGKSFQNKIIEKQEEIDELTEKIRELEKENQELQEELQVKKLGEGAATQEPIVIPKSISEEDAIKELKRKLDQRNILIQEQSQKVDELKGELESSKEKLIEFANITKNLKNEMNQREEKTKEYLREIRHLREELKAKDAVIKRARGLLD